MFTGTQAHRHRQTQTEKKIKKRNIITVAKRIEKTNRKYINTKRENKTLTGRKKARQF